MNHIVYNAIRTPDGTIIESRTRHDYVTHIDKNGKEYSVDGGIDYLRGSTKDCTELHIYSDDPHVDVREAFRWGTYGVDGKAKLRYVLLKDLSTEHIEAILNTVTFLPEWRQDIFKAELLYRRD